MPAFSILIPVYNSEKYLHECINSILKQTFHDFEIILLDDGSTDTSAQICDEFAAQNHKITVIHQLNQGPLIARISAYNAASGDFILYMDSDDCWDNQLLSYVYDTFNHFQCDIVSFTWKYMHNDNMLKEPISIYPKDNTIYKIETMVEKLLTEEVENALWKKAIRKSQINTEHLSHLSTMKNLRIGEDMLQSFVMVKDCRTMVYLDKALYFYRNNVQGLTSRSSIQKAIRDIATAREYMYKLLKESAFNKPEYLRMLEKNFLEHYLTDLVVLSSTNKISVVRNISFEIKKKDIYKNAAYKINLKQLPKRRQFLYYLEKKNLWKCFWLTSRIYKKLIA